jgi:hypothetical protein
MHKKAQVQRYALGLGSFSCQSEIYCIMIPEPATEQARDIIM